MNPQQAAVSIDRAVHEEAKRFRELDLEPGMNPSGGTPDCGNKEALEDLFTAATAHWFAGELQLPFQQVIYAPNRSVENRCGFDLSVAPVNARDLRLRIQAKFEATWCDVANTIELRGERNPGGEPMTLQNRLHHQVGLLCSTYGESGKRSYPYLLVQQCYCLHEYRRMGCTVGSVPVPPIDHRLRSIVLDLTKEEFATTYLNFESWTIRITSDPAAGTAKAEVQITGGPTIPLTVRGLGDLAKHLRGEPLDP